MQNQLNYLQALITKRLKNMDERGASAVEYGLLVGAIAVAIIAAVFLLGTKIKGYFDNTNTTIENQPAAG